MAFDGSIKIDTQIDSSTIKKSLKNLEKALKKTTTELSSINKAIKNVVSNLNNMQKVKFDDMLSSFKTVWGRSVFCAILYFGNWRKGKGIAKKRDESNKTEKAGVRWRSFEKSRWILSCKYI